MAFTEAFQLVRPRQNLSILPKPPSPYANPDEIEAFLGEVLVVLDVIHDSALAVQEGARMSTDRHFLYGLTREEHLMIYGVRGLTTPSLIQRYPYSSVSYVVSCSFCSLICSLILM